MIACECRLVQLAQLKCRAAGPTIAHHEKARRPVQRKRASCVSSVQLFGVLSSTQQSFSTGPFAAIAVFTATHKHASLRSPDCVPESQ